MALSANALDANVRQPRPVPMPGQTAAIPAGNDQQMARPVPAEGWHSSVHVARCTLTLRPMCCSGRMNRCVVVKHRQQVVLMLAAYAVRCLTPVSVVPTSLVWHKLFQIVLIHPIVLLGCLQLGDGTASCEHCGTCMTATCQRDGNQNAAVINLNGYTRQSATCCRLKTYS